MQLAALVGALLVSSMAVAEMKTETVEYQAGQTRLRGTLIYDDQQAGAKPAGVLLFSEWWGANDYIKSRARMIAELGYVAFVADMYGEEKTTQDPKEAQSLAGAVYADPNQMVARATAALDALRQSKRADEKRIGAIGYCMGGSVALQLVRSGAEIKSLVVFHGGLADHGLKAKPIKASILVCNGAADEMVTPAEISAFMEEMRKLQVDWQLIQYGGAMHAFTNPKADELKARGMKSIGYDQRADVRSWKLMVSHLAETLGNMSDQLGTPTPTATR